MTPPGSGARRPPGGVDRRPVIGARPLTEDRVLDAKLEEPIPIVDLERPRLGSRGAQGPVVHLMGAATDLELVRHGRILVRMERVAAILSQVPHLCRADDQEGKQLPIDDRDVDRVDPWRKVAANAGQQRLTAPRALEQLAAKRVDGNGYVVFEPGLARGEGGLAPALLVATDSRGVAGNGRFASATRTVVMRACYMR